MNYTPEEKEALLQAEYEKMIMYVDPFWFYAPSDAEPGLRLF